jgi:DNA mismatch repair protein MutL
MSNIRILPDILANKIAAGEVVERPASVVKELAENALDAGAARLLVDIEQGGRSLIRVADDGCGMSRDDALLSIERHATSKITSDRDLFSIRTLGFRGEALPSIAAVSKLSLITREAAADSGTELSIEGGRLVNVTEAGAPAGTLVTVRQLFFNTPARRKFLKAIATEMAHIADILASMALAWPHVQFRLTHNERVVKSWPAVDDPFERAADVLGGVPRAELHAVESSREGLAISGWISSPRTFRRSAGGVFVLVNRRFVRDRVVQHALFQGYSQRLVKGQFPLAVLFIRVPFDQVDVNVHPAKSEVRFARPNDVHEAVRQAVAQTLYDVDRPGFRQRTPETNQVRDAREIFGDRRLAGEASGRDDRGGAPLPPLPAQSYAQPRSSIISPPAARLQTEIWETRGFAGMRVIGQVHATYILCEAEDGLVLIDQHAAHERVLYDQLTRQADSLRRHSQVLLVPETVELGFREAQAIQTLMPHLRELGVDVEPFGGNTVVIKAVPGFLAGRDMRPLLTEMAAAGTGPEEAPGDPQAALDFCRQRAACHGAVRAGQTLAAEQMQALLRQLEESGNLSHCPHGRPTWIKWERTAIERSFRRVV